MARLLRVLRVLVLLGAPAVVAAAGDGPEPVHATLTVKLAAGKATYFLGELIPLELEFRGEAGADYYFSTAGYDRSGRLGLERYVVTPEGGSEDPLAEYFSSFGLIGGGLSSWHPLDGTPFVQRGMLNEWVRFTRPGRYQLRVQSTRLGRYSGGPAPGLQSTPIELQIEPAAPDWAGDQVAGAVARLRGSREERSQAIAVLRHLGTREAGLALARHYREGGDELSFAWFAAIVASPFRRDVVRALEVRLDSEDTLPAGFVPDLARLRSLLDHGSGAAHYEERAAGEHAAACEYTGRRLARVGQQPTAAALAAAMRAAGEDGSGCAGELPELLARHAATAREALAGLPPDEQARLLQYGWKAIGGEWALPALLDLYQRWTGNPRFPGAGDAALRRIAELDGRRGRELAIVEIRSGAHGITADTLLSLVPDRLPGLDEALVTRYRRAATDEAQAVAMWLVARHGSPALESFVRGEVELGAACELEAAGLGFLLTHAPGTALDRLAPGFERRGGCVVPPWDPLAARHWDARLEAAAIAHVERGTTRQVADAARVLQQHGSVAVKEPLLRGLARWNESWRSRGTELAALAAGPPALDSPLLVENALTNALANARSFTLSADETARVRGLCLTRGCRDNVDALAHARAMAPPRP